MKTWCSFLSSSGGGISLSMLAISQWKNSSEPRFVTLSRMALISLRRMTGSLGGSVVICILQSLGHERESNLEQLAEERTWKEKRKQSGRYCDQSHTKNELLEARRWWNLSGWNRSRKLKHQRCPRSWECAGHADRIVECVSAIDASSTRARWSGARPCYKHERVPLMSIIAQACLLLCGTQLSVDGARH